MSLFKTPESFLASSPFLFGTEFWRLAPRPPKYEPRKFYRDAVARGELLRAIKKQAEARARGDVVVGTTN